MLSALTLNIGAAALARAGALLDWLATRPEDVFLLTETSNGAGTAHLVRRFEAAGYAVHHTPDGTGDRGVAIVSRLPVLGAVTLPDVSLPARVAVVRLDTEPAVAVMAVYVPNRDRSAAKTERKSLFVRSVLAALRQVPGTVRDHLILGGDYNVIGRTHRPRHPGFLPFEFEFLDALAELGLADAYEAWAPGDQQFSWIGRTGDGYRYDYFHVGRALTAQLRGCAYLHETRELRLTDHAAVSLQLDVAAPARLDVRDPRTSTQTPALF